MSPIPKTGLLESLSPGVSNPAQPAECGEWSTTARYFLLGLHMEPLSELLDRKKMFEPGSEPRPAECPGTTEAERSDFLRDSWTGRSWEGPRGGFRPSH